MKDKIEFSEFLEIEKKLEIKLGKITEVSKIVGSNKMLILSVDFGEESERTVVTNIGKGLTEEEAKGQLENKQNYFVTNLKPVEIMGIESTAMILVNMEGDKMHLGYAPKGSKLL